MASLGVRELLDLPIELSRLIHDFAFRPSLGAHPERLALPMPLDSTSDAVQVIAIERGLLGPAAGPVDAERCLGQIDCQSPLHRIALLPREILEALAWYMGLAAFRDRLRRIVMRDELRALHAQGLSSEHLDFVYQIPDSPGRQGASTGAAAAVLELAPANWPQRIQAHGWSILSALRAVFPASIAARYQLKLPPEAPARAGDEHPLPPNDPRFEWVRERVVAAWRPDFDSSLSALASRSGRRGQA